MNPQETPPRGHTGPLRVFAGAGEASGDRILAQVLGGLREALDKSASGAEGTHLELRGIGGPLSEGLSSSGPGLKSLFPVRDLAVNGILDVARRALFLARAYARLRRALVDFRPDLVLLVDYPGMNVGLARLARRRGIPVHYIAPPQLWAYRDPRARLRRLRAALAAPGSDPSIPPVSLQFLFPFEAGSYPAWDGPTCQGHFFDEPAFEPARGSRLLLCPGSRRAVLARNLPLWLRQVRAFFGTLEGVDILVPEFLAEETRRLVALGEVTDLEAPTSTLPVVLTDKARAFARAGAALAYPGTITLELVLRRIPTRAWAIVDPVTLWMGRRKLRGPWLCLPNVLLAQAGGKRAGGEIPEIIPEWVGTVTDFKSNPPSLPEHVANWGPAETGHALAHVWEAMGSDQGTAQAVKACRSLLGL